MGTCGLPVTDQMRRVRKKREELKIRPSAFSQHLLRVCDVPDPVPGAGYLAPWELPIPRWQLWVAGDGDPEAGTVLGSCCAQ